MFDTKRIALIKEKVASRVKLSSEFFHDPNFEFHEDMVYDKVIAQLSAYVFRHPDLKYVTFEEPRTWWQHFKKECFPKWALKRWPVQHHIHRKCIRQLWGKVPPTLGKKFDIVYQSYDLTLDDYIDSLV